MILHPVILPCQLLHTHGMICERYSKGYGEVECESESGSGSENGSESGMESADSLSEKCDDLVAAGMHGGRNPLHSLPREGPLQGQASLVIHRIRP